MAEDESSKTTIVEERVEFMVDPTASNAEQNPTKRTGYFLKPSLNLNAVPPKLPKIQSFSSLTKPNVVFLSHSTPLKGWQTWVKKLEETHEAAWRKAGIFDAIKGSIYHIRKSDNLIYRLVEKWCPETNTFVFPWGEATVTLEDVFVLGGFSPLGVSVSSNSSCLGDNVQQVENKLIQTFRKLRNYHPNVSQLRWLEHFMGCGDEIEYAGFLALWLTRHVFPGRNFGAVLQAVFVMAARISCGAKLAFGPVILASIYRDLTLIRKEIVGSLSGHCASGSSLKVSSPLHLVQVWAWERFSSLGPPPRMIGCGEVRLARWEGHSRKLLSDIDNIDMCLDSGRENFRWRPYSMSIENWSLPRFYVNSGMWVVVDSDEEWKSFARCLMFGQLRGLDCVERYNPHRVALQFGFDQDIPESVDISKSSNTLDELVYRMNFKGLKLYLPPRLHEGDITFRYFDWWGTRLDDVVQVGCKRKKSTENRVNKMAKTFDRSNKLEAIVIGNVRENSMEESPPMREDGEDEVWTTNRSMGKCSKINVSCSKLAETELSKGIDQEDGGMEQAASKHPNLGNEIGQVMARSLLLRPEGDLGKSEDVAREQNKERNVIKHGAKIQKKSEYLETNIIHVKTPTEINGTFIRMTCEDEPAEALCRDPDINYREIPVYCRVAASLQSDQKSFAARCLDYETRMCRLERLISALSVYKPI